jgi:hypothetical protein
MQVTIAGQVEHIAAFKPPSKSLSVSPSLLDGPAILTSSLLSHIAATYKDSNLADADALGVFKHPSGMTREMSFRIISLSRGLDYTSL